MTTKLIVIGNGFDLHHGIPSRYTDFGNYLSRTDPETYSVVEKYLTIDDEFWWEFEARLAFLDADTLVSEASDYLVSYGADDWSDAYHHDYQYEITQVVQALSKTLRDRFADWVRQLPFPNPAGIDRLRLPVEPNARFLNFNYTPTLQRLYGIPEGQILHIHGSSANLADQLVLGHARRLTQQEAHRARLDPESADSRVVEGAEIVDRYFSDTFKPTEKIILKHASFFSGLSAVTNVMVMGHSLADVDRPYFEEIMRSVAPDARWMVSYHERSDATRERLAELGVDLSRVRLLQLQEF